MYTFKIIKNKKGQFRAQFCFRKEVIFWTESYTRKPSAKNAIDSFIKNAAKAPIEEIDENAKPVAKVAAKAVGKKVAAKKVIISKAPVNSAPKKVAMKKVAVKVEAPKVEAVTM